MWEVKPWYISGVLTGYRVIKHGPFGDYTVDSAYVWDRYGSTPLHEYQLQAEDRCKVLNGDHHG
jgi:hypothetical protein